MAAKTSLTPDLSGLIGDMRELSVDLRHFSEEVQRLNNSIATINKVLYGNGSGKSLMTRIEMQEKESTTLTEELEEVKKTHRETEKWKRDSRFKLNLALIALFGVLAKIAVDFLKVGHH